MLIKSGTKAAVVSVALASVLSYIPVSAAAAVPSVQPARWVIRLTLMSLGPDHHVDLDSYGDVRIFEASGDKVRPIERWRLDQRALREFDAIVEEASGGPMPYKRAVPGTFVPIVSDCHSTLRIDFYRDDVLNKTTGDLVCQGGVDDAPLYVRRLTALLSKYILTKDERKPAPW